MMALVKHEKFSNFYHNKAEWKLKKTLLFTCLLINYIFLLIKFICIVAKAVGD